MVKDKPLNKFCARIEYNTQITCNKNALTRYPQQQLQHTPARDPSNRPPQQRLQVARPVAGCRRCYSNTTVEDSVRKYMV